MRRTIPIVCLVGLLVLSACGNGDEGASEAAGQEQAAPPMAEVLAGRVPVIGTETCQHAVDAEEVLDDGSEVIRETFTCDVEMSDPRASGTEVSQAETTIIEPDDVTVAWTGEGTVANDEGSWSGPSEGVYSTESAMNYGQVTYEGQGAYGGLIMHLLFAGINGQLSYSGWIEGPGEGAPAEASDGRTPVIGTDTCQRRVDSDEYLDDGTEVMRETFTCDLEMSDPRASGRDVWHVESTFIEPNDVTVAATGEGTLTSEVVKVRHRG